MITGTPRWSLKLTHEPTGIYVEVNSNNFRTQQQAKEAGLKLLKARINFMMSANDQGGDILVSSYALPDEVFWPDNLQNYKQ